MANREIEARLRISATDKTGAAFKSVQGKIHALEQRAGAFNRVSRAMNNGVADMVGMVSRYAAPAALAYGLVQATRAAGDFEKSLAAVQKKSGATAGQMAKIREEAFSLAQEVPVSIDEIVSAMDRGAAAGIPLDELKAFTKLTAQVADAWDTTSEDTGNFFAGFNKGLGIAIPDLEKFASLINDLADSGISSERDIADFIDRAGASLKNFGLSPNEIAAYGASLLNLKMPSEVAARAMDTLTGKLIAPENLSNKSRGALGDIVGDLNAFAKLSGNQKLAKFMGELQKMSGQRRASLLGALLGDGFDDEIMRAVSGLEEVNRNLEIAHNQEKNPSTSIATQATRNMQLWNSQVQIFKNNLKEAAVAIGDIFAQPSWLKSLNDMIQQIKDIRASHAGMSSEEIAQERDAYVKRYLDIYKPKNEREKAYVTGRALDSYDQASRAVGSGNVRNVDEFLDHLKKLERYINGQVAPAGGPHRTPYGAIEFPGTPEGGGLKKDKRGRPIEGPIPGQRPTDYRAISTENLRNLQEQYAQYGGGVQTKNLYGRGDSVFPIKSTSTGDASFTLDLAPYSEAAGKEIEKSGSDLASGLRGVVDAVNSIAQKIRNIDISGPVSSGGRAAYQGGYGPPVNANIGSTSRAFEPPGRR